MDPVTSRPPDFSAAAREGGVAVRVFAAEIRRLEELRVIAMTKFQQDLRRVECLLTGENGSG